MNDPGSLVQAASDKDAPLPTLSTSAPVRYADGVVTIAETDLYSDGFGFPWGQTRSWTNSPLYTSGSDNGNGWVDTYTPHLVNGGNGTIIYIANGNTAFYYDLVNGVYQPRISDGTQLIYNSDSDTYTLIDTQGDETVLDGFGASWWSAKRGQFASYTSSDGVTMSVTQQTSDGHIAQMQRSGGGGSESWLYSYVSSGVNSGLLSGVVLRSDGNTVRQVQYAYYDGTQYYGGKAGDLMTATVEDDYGNVLDTSYYRYNASDELAYVFNPDSYLRLTAALGTNLSSLSDAQVAPYADNYFQYDSSNRVTGETVQGAGSSANGGLGTYTFSYTASTNAPGFNSWTMQTVVTNPDNSTDTVFTNAYGEVLLDDHNDSGVHTVWFYLYNFNGQLVLAAAPSTGGVYNSSSSDLVNTTLTGDSLGNGLITRYDYYATTTATETTPGGVAGYLQDEQIQQGTLFRPILQETWQYYAHGYNGQTIAPLASDTVYRNDDSTGAETTSYAYTWYTNTAQIQSETDTAPVITAGQNGPGTADVTTISYDAYGNAQSTTDPDGYVQNDTYDPATGALLTDSVDANGLDLVTQYQVDALGRTIEVRSPAGLVSYYVYLDRQHEERIYSGWNGNTFLEPTQVIRDDPADGYSETFTMTATPHMTNGAPDGTEPISGLQTLTRDYTNAAGQVIAEDAYYNLNGLNYSTGTMGNVNVNYYQSQYSYDSDGRLYQTQTANGTLYQTLYNSLDEKVSDWVGTSTSNLVQTAAYQYDSDGNLTQETDYPGLGAANRVTDYWYDWRDRLVAEKDGVGSRENDGTNRPIIVTIYDNLDQVTSTQQYLGDNVTPQILNGELVPLDETLLRAEEIDNYDNQGRVYQSRVYDVSPSNGAVSSSALTTNYYYDHRGDLIAESDPGGLWTKSQYDGAGRDVMDYSTDGAGGTSWAAASSVANDTVLEQEQKVYDGDSNVLSTIDSQRFHNATGLGPLGTPSSGIGARVYYAANYYDPADRLIATVDAGTNGGTAWTRPATVPTSSPTLLVTQYVYNPAGWVQDTIDPMGIDTRTLYDNLGRTTQTIQNYTGNRETAESDVSTEYGYDGDNNVTYVQADEPGNTFQQTEYAYGVATYSGSAVNSNDILGAILYPDPTNGLPSWSQQDKYVVNALGQTVQSTDRNGNVHGYAYDMLGRLISDYATTLGAGVDGTVRQITYGYDSQGNLSDIQSVSSFAVTVNEVQRTFNGLGQLTGEYQAVSGAVNTSSTPQVQYAYNEMSNGENNSRLLSMTYPNGYGVAYNYNAGLDDSISRLSWISDGTGAVEKYLYLGLDTVVERDHPQTGINLTYIKQSGDPYANSDGGDPYTGLDRFGRVIDQFWTSSNSQSPGTLDRYQYSYNQDSEVVSRTNLLDTFMNEAYNYDNLGQLTSFARGSHTQSWTPDALGNFSSVTTDGTTQTRTANQQNEYSSLGRQLPAYDANGNLTADGTGNSYVYDAWNRLVAVQSNGSSVASYRYDGLNRLIQVTEGVPTDLYYSSSDQVLEEDQGNVPIAYNMWSPVYVNALVLRVEGYGYGAQRYYVLQDANWNVTAMVTTEGPAAVVSERYAYDPFGAVTALQPNWQPESSSVFKVPFGFQGMWYDWVTGENRANERWYNPSFMRWQQTDLIGFAAGDSNLYRFVGNSPMNATDPSGLAEDKLTQGPYGLLARLTLWWYNDSELDAIIEANKHQEFNPDQTNRPGLKIGDTIDREHRGWYNNTLQKFGPTVVGTMFLVGTTFFAGPEDAIISWLGSKGIRVLWEGGKRVLQKVIRGKWTRVAENEVECLAKEYTAARRAGNAPKGAYQIAKEGGKHAGVLKNYAGRTPAQIQKAITSLQEKAREHAAKAANPANYVPNWATLSAQEQQGLIRYWLKEAVNYAEQAQVLAGLLGG